MRHLFLFSMVVLIAGCGQKFDIKETCIQHPELCNDLHQDGWCRYERTQVVKGRYYYQNVPKLEAAQVNQDYNKYFLLKSLEQYEKCVNLTTHIEYKRDSANARKNDRVRGAAAARSEFLKLSKDVENDNGPFMLMWKWLWLGDKIAGRQFIALEGQDVLKHRDLQSALSLHYAQSNPRKAIHLLHYALFLQKEEQGLDNRLPPSLISLYMRTEQYEEVLLWSYVTQAFNKDDAGQVKPDQIAIYAKIPKKRQEQIEDESEDIIDSIRDFKYKMPKADKK